MSDGIGCVCAARSENECCCDADWRPQELIDLQQQLASRDAEVVSLTNQRDYEYVRAENAEQERDQLRAQVKMLMDAATRARRKLSAYVGVCTGDKELTNTIIPMLKEALAATEQK